MCSRQARPKPAPKDIETLDMKGKLTCDTNEKGDNYMNKCVSAL